MSDHTAEIPSELVDRARRGDDSSLRVLVERAYPSVRRWSLMPTGDPAEADDLTQDVLMQMLRKLGSFQSGARFTTWLYAVTRNAAADRFRRARRRDALAANPMARIELLQEPDDDPAGMAERATLRRLLDVLFHELPWRQREVFDLMELQGHSASYVGELHGIEPVTARAHLFKARRHLRALMLERHSELVEDFL